MNTGDLLSAYMKKHQVDNAVMLFYTLFLKERTPCDLSSALICGNYGYLNYTNNTCFLF